MRPGIFSGLVMRGISRLTVARAREPCSMCLLILGSYSLLPLLSEVVAVARHCVAFILGN